MWSHIRTDIRHAFRRAARRKWVSFFIIAGIALGSGATAALFTAVDRIVLRDLPVREPDRAFWVRTVDANTPQGRRINPGDAYDIRTRASSFAVMASYNENEQTLRIGDDGTPERVRIALVEPGMMQALGMETVRGRFFETADFTGVSANVLISHQLWQRAFGGDASIIGRQIYLNNVARTVIGVLPPAADVLPEPNFDIWRPLTDNVQQRTQPRTATFLQMIARLKPDFNASTAQGEIDALGKQIGAEQPLTNANRGFRLMALRDGVIGKAQPTFALLGGALIALLFIACASIGTLLAARSHERARELAVRVALGGRAGRLVQQLLTETLVLCLSGAVIGLVMAPVFLRAFVSLYPGGVPRAAEIATDFRTLAVSSAAILLAALMASIPVVRKVFGRDIGDYLRSGSRAGRGQQEQRVAHTLVTAQLAVSVILLFGGGLLLRTYRAMTSIDPGFDTAHVLTFDVTPSVTRYSTGELVDGYYEQLFERLRALPGVRNVGVSSLIPFEGGEFTEGILREGTSDATPRNPFVKLQLVSDGYIPALGLSLLKGRAIQSTDRDSATRVIVVNEAFGHQLYSGQEVIGKRVSMRGQMWEVVGVVTDKRHRSLREPPVPEIFISRQQLPRQLRAWVAVRTEGNPAIIIPAAREVSKALDPTVAVSHVATMDDRRSDAMAAERFRAVIVGAFAVIALVLAAMGLYGIVSYTVSQRTREIGIRVALGQNPTSVRWSVVRSAMVFCGAGLLIGGIGAWLSARMLQSFLVATTTTDPAVLAAVLVLFLGLTMVAAYVPARRASRIDPMTALRME